MKKVLVILSCLTLSLPALALCPVENGGKTCSIAEFTRKEFNSTFQENSNLGGLSQPNIELQPIKRNDPIEQMREPNNTLNYNSSCQFGICAQKPVKYSEMLNP